MMKEGRGNHGDPCSLIRDNAMMLRRIGFPEKAESLKMALDICGQYEKKLTITGRDSGASGEEFGNYLIETMQGPDLKSRRQAFVE